MSEIIVGRDDLCPIDDTLLFTLKLEVSALLFLLALQRISGTLVCDRFRKIQISHPRDKRIGQFRIGQQQKNRVEVQGNNLHFPLF